MPHRYLYSGVDDCPPRRGRTHLGVRCWIRRVDDPRSPLPPSARKGLPTFFGLFDMYGGPWSSRFGQRAFVCLLIGFDLPIPKVIGPVRIVFLARGWRSLH